MKKAFQGPKSPPPLLALKIKPFPSYLHYQRKERGYLAGYLLGDFRNTLCFCRDELSLGLYKL